MGRPGITYEQVEAAANALEAERSGAATLTAVCDQLGRGSRSTVNTHLKTWRASRPKALPPAFEVPEEVRKSLAAWLMVASTGARAEAEERAANAELASDDLTREAQDLERERDELEAKIAELTKQRDQGQATAEARAEDIERLEEAIARERHLAGEAQKQAAAAELKLEGYLERVADLKAQNSELAATVEAERTAHTDAERLAAVAAAELAGARADLDMARTQVAALQKDLAAARDQVDQLRAAHEARIEQDQRRIDALRAEHDEQSARVREDHEARIKNEQERLEKLRQQYDAQLTEERRALEHARGQVANAAVTQSELQGELKALAVENQALKARLQSIEDRGQPPADKS